MSVVVYENQSHRKVCEDEDKISSVTKDEPGVSHGNVCEDQDKISSVTKDEPSHGNVCEDHKISPVTKDEPGDPEEPKEEKRKVSKCCIN